MSEVCITQRMQIPSNDEGGALFALLMVFFQLVVTLQHSLKLRTRNGGAKPLVCTRQQRLIRQGPRGQPPPMVIRVALPNCKKPPEHIRLCGWMAA